MHLVLFHWPISVHTDTRYYTQHGFILTLHNISIKIKINRKRLSFSPWTVLVNISCGMCASRWSPRCFLISWGARQGLPDLFYFKLSDLTVRKEPKLLRFWEKIFFQALNTPDQSFFSLRKGIILQRLKIAKIVCLQLKCVCSVFLVCEQGSLPETEDDVSNENQTLLGFYWLCSFLRLTMIWRQQRTVWCVQLSSTVILVSPQMEL